MKTSRTLIRTSCVLVLATALGAVGCSKKAETPVTPAAVPAAAPKAPTAATAPAPAADPGKAAADMATAAKEKAAAEAKTMAAEAKKKADAAAATAAADAKKKMDQAAAAMTKPATPATPAAATAPKAAVPPTMTDAAAGASAAAGSTMDAMKSQAEGLLAEYSGELATLKKGAVTLKGLIDKNAGMLPEGVASKYQEFNALLPGLTSMVDSLKNYQSADLTTLVPKLKTDFSRAQTLYSEIKGLIPAM